MGFAVLPVDGNKTKDSFSPLQFDNQERETFRLRKIKSTHDGD